MINSILRTKTQQKCSLDLVFFSNVNNLNLHIYTCVISLEEIAYVMSSLTRLLTGDSQWTNCKRAGPARHVTLMSITGCFILVLCCAIKVTFIFSWYHATNGMVRQNRQSEDLCKKSMSTKRVAFTMPLWSICCGFAAKLYNRHSCRQPLVPAWLDAVWLVESVVNSISSVNAVDVTLGLCSLRRHHHFGIGIPIINLRRSSDIRRSLQLELP